MNPNNWKWYTYVVMVVIALQIVMVFIALSGNLPIPWIGLFISTFVLWFSLWLLHEIVRAFYLAFTGKVPPPINRPH